MIFENGQKLLFIGDSVTDAGRARPAGEGLFGALGTGYVQLVESLMNASYPDRAVRVVNMGVGGDTARHLDARWATDVFGHQPDWVAVMIGINDVWRQFDSPRQPEACVLPDEYGATLSRLVEGTLPRVKGMVLMTPYYIEGQRDDAMRRRMDEYGAIVKVLAARHSLRCVDTQAAFDRQLEHHYSAFFGWDRVHPNPLGCMVIARAFLEAVGYRW